MIDAVVKVGGALLADRDAFEHTLSALERVRAVHRLLIVPGGGPFADAVRTVDQRYGLTCDDAHWMAILGMEQFALALASKLHCAALVHDRDEIVRAHAQEMLPVLAPYRWLREADPLPHSWDVTSDSIAAWVASELGAARLVLIKPDAHDALDALDALDRYFDRARAPTLKCSILTPRMLTGNWFPA